MSNQEYDWTPENESVTVNEQKAIAIYENPYGCVVIKQQRSWDEDEDPFITIAPEHVDRLIDRIKQVRDTMAGQARGSAS